LDITLYFVRLWLKKISSKIYEESFKYNWDLPALTNYTSGETISYREYATEIARLHLLFKQCKIRKDDKIALVGKNNINWCTVYMAAITYGAIIVPILQDFHPKDIQHIINQRSYSEFQKCF